MLLIEHHVCTFVNLGNGRIFICSGREQNCWSKDWSSWRHRLLL